MKKILLGCLLLVMLILPMSAESADWRAIKRTDISTTTVNFDFGFTARIIMVYSDSTNDAEICINWGGDPAACPAANTWGADRLPVGQAITLDNYGISNISIIAASGTQILYIRAWR